MQNEIQKEHVVCKKGNAATEETNAKRKHREQKTNPKCKQESLKGNIEQHEHEA